MTIYGIAERLWRAQFVRFAAIGTAAFFVDTAVLYLGLARGLGLYSGRAVSYLVAATFTWYGNRRLTFVGSRASGTGRIATEWLTFVIANLGGGAVNYTIYAVLIALLPLARAYPVIGVAAGSLAGFALNFTVSKLVVFRSRRTDQTGKSPTA